MAGADAILLIVGVLGDNDLRRLRELAESLGMAALVEVHDEAETERALKSGARIVGVNNRNLRTFAVDIETTGRLRPLIPRGRHPGRRERHPHADDVRRMADGLRRHPGGRDLLQAAAGRTRRQSEGVRARRRNCAIIVAGNRQHRCEARDA
jgi:indole-3-glycerol phosphate synthase